MENSSCCTDTISTNAFFAYATGQLRHIFPQGQYKIFERNTV